MTIDAIESPFSDMVQHLLSQGYAPTQIIAPERPSADYTDVIEEEEERELKKLYGEIARRPVLASVHITDYLSALMELMEHFLKVHTSTLIKDIERKRVDTRLI